MQNGLRLAVAGSGNSGKRHAKAITEVTGAHLAAVYDIDPAGARALAEEHGAPCSGTDLAAMLAEGDIDAVSICTDHGSHGRLLDPSAAAGVHCIVERPLSIRLSEAKRMVAVAREAGVTFGAIFQRRLFPAALRMKAAIAAGRIGRVTSAESIAHLGRDEAYFAQADWRGTWAGEGDGALMNHAIHMVDMLQWMVGDPVEIYDRWATLKPGDYINVEDTTVPTIIFANGALASIQAVTTLDPAFGFRLTVHGGNGATLDPRESPELTQAVTDLWTREDEPDPREAWELTGETRPGFLIFHRLQLQDFADVIREKRDPLVTGPEGTKALHIINGMYLSQHRGLPVRLPLDVDAIAEVETFDTRA